LCQGKHELSSRGDGLKKHIDGNSGDEAEGALPQGPCRPQQQQRPENNRRFDHLTDVNAADHPGGRAKVLRMASNVAVELQFRTQHGLPGPYFDTADFPGMFRGYQARHGGVVRSREPSIRAGQ
jgi:hypothetical protein